MLKRTNTVFLLGYILCTCIPFSSSYNQDFPLICDEFYNRSCLNYFDHEETWAEANTNCSLRDSYLTSIHSESENTLLRRFVQLNNSTHEAWIGLSTTENGSKTNWADESQVTYTKTVFGLSPGCVAIHSTGNWFGADCNQPFNYICKQQAPVFGRLSQEMRYTKIKNNEILNMTNLSTLICRTDTYPSTSEITWDYKDLESANWISIESNWNNSNGISTVTTEKGNGYYRCHLKIGGVENLYTAKVIIFKGMMSTESIQTMTINTNTTKTTQPTIQMDSILYIAVGATVGGLVIIILILIIIILLVIYLIRKKKPKAYQYLSKAKYSNSLSLVLKPNVPTKKKEGRLTYQNLMEFTPGIEITEKELMDALESPAMEIPEAVYSTDYVNVSELRHIPATNYEEIDEISNPRFTAIQLDVYKTYLKDLWKREGALEEEYKSLGGVSLRYPCENALLEQNIPKNKYKMLYPYDKSRILLTPIRDDPTTTYINASYIPGVYTNQNFITAQAPMGNTIEDFWRLVFENKLESIVMLTNIIEGNRKKCEMYFPLDTKHPETFGSIVIHLVKTEIFPGSITRVIKVEKEGKSVQVNHYHFTAWPDHDVPSVFEEFLTFVKKTYESLKLTKSSILVHCSAGVGRSGTYITLYNIMEAIERSKPISIYKIVHQMREHRPQMVQTFRQYKFIYLAVSEMLFQDTAIDAKEFTKIYEQYKQTDIDGYESVLNQQFNELNFQTDNSFKVPSESGNDKENEAKNPRNSIIPYDENRVMLVPVNDGNDYINASYMMNLNFIATVHPKLNTLADFLQMIYQTGSTLVIMLTTRKEKGEIENRVSQRASYWGKTDESIEIPPFTVTNTHSEKSTTMIRQTLTITNNRDGFSSSFKQIISLAWNEMGEPNDLSNIILLIHTMKKYKQENPNLPIIVHCSDGIGRTGVLLTTYKNTEDIETKDSIDMFHTIKHLRSDRMKFVPTLVHFLSCFALTNEYCSTM